MVTARHFPYLIVGAGGSETTFHEDNVQVDPSGAGAMIQ